LKSGGVGITREENDAEFACREKKVQESGGAVFVSLWRGKKYGAQ